MEMNSLEQERRSCFRVIYPPRRSPTLYLNGAAYPVMDLGEKGVRFINRRRRKLPEDITRFKVAFHDGETVDVIGRLIRANHDQVVFSILRGIPYQRIIKEQLQFRRQ
jgi:hypothetical protein